MQTTRTPTDTELAARLRLAVMRLARRLRQQSVPGPTPSMLSALSTLERLGPLTYGELAGAEAVRPPSMTRIVGRLEEEGLVERHPDETDHRIGRLRLTSAGRELIRRNRRRKDAYLARGLGRLSAREVAALATAASVLERLLDEEEG